jgi:formylglycine-generating enzyme required for sulfatase activity
VRPIVALLLLLLLGLANAAGAEEITIMLPGEVPMVLVRVPAGTFLMGSPAGERGNVFNNETQHQVTLTKDYFIGKFEVTQRQWLAVTGQTVQAACATSNNVPNPLVGVGDDNPMYCVSWDRIAGPGGFLEKLHEHLGSTRLRLPTEAEWERAARAETTTRFSHGDILECGDDCQACSAHEAFMWWCGDDSAPGPKPVGQKQPNGFGLYDMHGNVFEIVNDRYADDYGNPSGGPVTDPTGPVTTGDVVFKGGGWENEAWFNRVAVRLGTAHGDQAQNDGVGFRLAACAGPAITTQPASTTTGIGEEATLSVVATASEGALSYQWYEGTSGDTSRSVPGATSASLKTSPASTTSYWVRVSDGCSSADSMSATVTVSDPTVEIVWPASGMTLAAHGASIKADVKGFVLDCAGIGGASVAGHGHMHIRIDGALDTEACASTAALTNNLTPGPHTIEVELVENDHSSFASPVKASVPINVPNGTSTYTPASLVTGVARTAGAGGAFFKTSLWLTAPAGEAIVQLRFVPAPGQPEADFPVAHLTIPDKHSIVFADALRNAFGVTGGAFGNIIISVADGSVSPTVSARTFNDQREISKGTFGQFISGIDVIGSNSGAVQIDGLSASADFRTNVGVINHDLDNTLTATITILDGAGKQKGDPIVVSVPPGSLVQTNTVASGLGLDRFSVRVSGVGPFSAYSSKLDNPTSDPIFIMDNASSDTRQWIDGVGSMQGGGGTFFKSELSLTNRTGSSATVTISFVSRGAATPDKTEDVMLAAGESKLYMNAVKEIFGLDNVGGSFWITGPAGLAAWARTYNDLTESGGQGTFGQFIPAFDATNLIGLSGAIIPGLSHNAEFRTNAGFLNTGQADVSVTVSVWSSGGQQLGMKSYLVPAGTAIFVPQIIADIGVPSLSDGYIKLIPSAGGAVYGWASSVDNVSTDQTFFRPIGLD